MHYLPNSATRSADAPAQSPPGAEALFHRTSQQCARLVTERYSTSFTLGIKSLSPPYRPAIYSIYGFVRYADEIVDTFHGHDKRRLLDAFTRDTWQAIEEGLSLNPVLDAYQQVVNRYHIPRELTEAFLRSMEMDLDEQTYGRALYETYIYGSAEVVGLMCLRVFCEGDEAQYCQLEGPARSLGAAFQKVNFLRDIQSDFADRGRIYFPGLDLDNFDARTKGEIERDIETDFRRAFAGIQALPTGARMGVYLAYVYYRRLFRQICRTQPERIMQERIRVPNALKMWLLCGSYLRFRLNLI